MFRSAKESLEMQTCTRISMTEEKAEILRGTLNDLGEYFRNRSLAEFLDGHYEIYETSQLNDITRKPAKALKMSEEELMNEYFKQFSSESAEYVVKHHHLCKYEITPRSI